MVWLGVAITLALIAGYSSLIYVSHKNAPQPTAPAVQTQPGTLNTLLGVPLKHHPHASDTKDSHPSQP